MKIKYGNSELERLAIFFEGRGVAYSKIMDYINLLETYKKNAL